MEPESGVIENGRHRLPIRVYYEDTDTGGIVYHAKYLHFMERGRSNMLRLLQISHADAWHQSEPGQRLGFAVRQCQIDFLRPAVLDDALIVESCLKRVAAAYTDAEQTIWRGDEMIARASIRVAMVDGTGRPRRIPAPWRQKFEMLVQT